ncbi:MAG: Fur family transcriptional regulator [Tepidisphaeraceae bacterium]
MNTRTVTDLLHQAGLRRTPVRVGVIEHLHKSNRPLSVQDLAGLLPEGTDLVTVYRTLNTLVKKGLARRVRGEDRSWLFEIAHTEKGHDDHVHAHFVCDTCGTVECLPDVELPPVPRKPIGKGYDITKQEVTLHGTCPKCHD